MCGILIFQPFKSSLCTVEQRVSYGGILSGEGVILQGVMQDSILSPVVPLFYIK